MHEIDSPAAPPREHEVVVAVHAAQLTRARLHHGGGVPGFAATGRVVAAGEQALSLLDRVVLVGAVDPCGQCEVCRRGGGAVCPHTQPRGGSARGTLAERVTVAARWVVPLDQELGLQALRGGDAADDGDVLARTAALAGDAALAYTLYARADLSPRDPVVLLGRTPVTRFLVEVLLAKGLVPTVLVDGAADEHGAAWRTWLAARDANAVEVTLGEDAALTRAEIERGLARRAASQAAELQAARPWKLLVTEPRALLLASRLAGPRALLAVLAPPETTADDVSSLDPLAWLRELAVLSVTTASPELVLETAALAVRGELDLGAGTAVHELSELAPDALAAIDPTRSLVVRVPVAR
ncbi:MAG: alcohol dehydrogenase catalytic domain-containing protein [Kofleriaceae bacterium]